MFPTTIQELYERKVKEEMWYKSVCPFCDKKFTEPNTKKRHIEMHHMNKKLPCKKCEKSFQGKQSLEYHYLTTHQKKTTLYFACEVCEKTFITKIGLNNHMKFKHTENFEQNVCDICEAKFKHEKYLKAHKLHVHGLDQKTEDYWQDIPRKVYECETCNTKFMRKADLKVHMQSKHIKSPEDIFKCDKCNAEFKYNKNLKRHWLEKHGKEMNNFNCPDCGKVFIHKRNMERHQLSHKKK